MKIRIIFAIAIFLAYAAEQSLAQDPELILDPISFDNRQLVISYTTNPQAQFTNCDLKIRTSDKQGPLSSPGLGKLLSNSTNVTSDQFYAGLSSIFTNSLTRKPKNGLAYFRVYLTCSDFVIQSNIESYDFSAIKIKKVKFNKWVRHVKSKIDQF